MLSVVKVSPAMLGLLVREVVVVSNRHLLIFNWQVGSKALRNSPIQSKKRKMSLIFSEGLKMNRG